MATALERLPSFRLDPSHPERVPEGAVSLHVHSLEEVDVPRLARLRSLRVVRVYGGIRDATALNALAAALPTVERLELYSTRLLGADVLDAVERFPSLAELALDALAVPTREVLPRVLAMRPWSALRLCYLDTPGEELAGIASSPALRALALTVGGPITAATLAPIGSIAPLRSLDLFSWSDESVPMSALPWLPKLTSLRHLEVRASLDATVAAFPDLNSLRCTDAPPASRIADLASLLHLTTLELVAYTTWTAAHTAALAKLPVVDTFTAWRVPLDERGLAALLRARPWRSLTLDGLGASGASFSEARSLEALDLRFSDLDDDGLRAISGLPSLRSLAVSHCSKVTVAGVAALGALPALRSFRVEGLRSLDDAALAPIVALPSLEALEIHGSPRVTNGLIASVAARPGFAYAGPPCLAEAQQLRADAHVVTEPITQGVHGDAAGTFVALRGHASVALARGDAAPKDKQRHLRAAACEVRLDMRGSVAVTAGAAMVAWDVASGKKRATCKVPRGLMQALDLSADGSLAVAVVQRGYDALVLGWAPERDESPFSFATVRADAAAVALSPHLNRVVLSTSYVDCHTLDDRQLWRIPNLSGPVVYRADGSTVVVASPEGVVVLDAETGKERGRLTVDHFARAWWVLYEQGALVPDRAVRTIGALTWRSIEARADGDVVLTATLHGSSAWMVARLRGATITAARVAEPDGGSLRPCLGLSRSGAHAWVHVYGDRGVERSVGAVSRYLVDTLLEG